MINDYFYYSLILMGIILLALLYLEGIDLFLEYKKSQINGRTYGIQEIFNNTNIAVDMLARIHTKIEEYTTSLYNKYPNDNKIKRMKKRLKDMKIEESPDEIDTSSYTINKGELIAFCLRPKTDRNSFYDDNTLWFVIAHELAHVMSESEGHNNEFIANFKFILKTSHELGFYNNPIDYKLNPITYCGVKVSNNPFY